MLNRIDAMPLRGLGLIGLGLAIVSLQSMVVAMAATSVLRVDISDSRIIQDGPRWLLDGNSFSGELRRLDSDDAVTILPIIDGWLDGLTRSNYANGKVRGEGAFVKNQPTGLHRSWWPNGQLQAERNFIDGMPEGIMRTWYASGQRYQQHRYHLGQESGLQQVWKADGSVRASYEIRNGRRYGNIGAMGCAGGDRPPTKAGPAPSTENKP
jgi:MORN repeat variant